MFVIVLLVVITGFRMLFLRIDAVRSGAVKFEYFKTFSTGDQLPEKMLAAQRHFTNLFEVPVLFLTVCCLAIATHIVAMPFCVLAWVFVAFRITHSFIHLTHNKVKYRMPAFMGSMVTMVIMWVWTVVQLAQTLE
jgi:hypothetical protein